jgi:5'-deoxynucleotidase
MAGVSHFFAYLARMKYIQRWGLMRNTRQENIQEHSLQVAMVAHALALIDRDLYGGGADPERTVLLAVYHDAEEVITGDLPTPIKYFSPRIAAAVDDVEEVARQRLLAMLPVQLQPSYAPLLQPEEADAAAWRLVKLADRTCAYLKCVEEAKAGNREFGPAETTIRGDLERAARDEPALAYFLQVFVPSFELTLDELN